MAAGEDGGANINVPFVVATFVGLLLPLFAPSRKPTVGRRVFWSGLALAVGSGFFIAYPPDWRAGAAIAGWVGAMMLVTAYFYSPHLQLRGRVKALFTGDAEVNAMDGRERPVPDGVLTSARKLWWVTVPGMTLCSFNVAQYVVGGENPRLAVVAAAVIVVLGGGFGFIEGRAGDAIARRETLQFVLVAIVTLGVFTVLYLGGYAVGRRQRRRHDPRACP
ncbi:hypothetical protein [Mycolicibacterium sediminis]|uniref:Uncharacterized protein n=1 Tax=Mycolicibacterium sediminis TaxID=1286180 RepID=A0A7I7QP81_9MYCO|nr:hypothetical protein [Mycolicibacterium sediminis]BBY28085.1 hypothetical protein MSEDJ_21810 [Mycolicibacterium sediminis]